MNDAAERSLVVLALAWPAARRAGESRSMLLKKIGPKIRARRRESPRQQPARRLTRSVLSQAPGRARLAPAAYEAPGDRPVAASRISQAVATQKAVTGSQRLASV